jgi:Cdc6-like AAA superfamily ATPase
VNTVLNSTYVAQTAKQRNNSYIWYKLSGSPFKVLNDTERDELLRNFLEMLSIVKQGVLLVRKRLRRFLYKDYEFIVSQYNFFLGVQNPIKIPLFDAVKVKNLSRPKVECYVNTKTLLLEGELFARVMYVYSYPETFPEAFLYTILPLVDEVILFFKVTPKHTILSILNNIRKRRALTKDIEHQNIDEIIQSIMKGNELFELYLAFILIDKNIESLNEREKKLKSYLNSLGIVVESLPAPLQKSLYNFSTCSWIFCIDGVYVDSESLKALYMLIDENVYEPSGVFIGVSDAGNPVVIDVWNRRNTNFIVCGAPSSGKSTFTKIFLKRLIEKSREEGIEVPVIGIDLRSEYTRVASLLRAKVFEIVEIPGKGLNRSLGLDPIKLMKMRILTIGEVVEILLDLYRIPTKYQDLLKKLLISLEAQVKDFQDFVIAIDIEAERRRSPRIRTLVEYLAEAVVRPEVDVFRGELPEIKDSIIFSLKDVESWRLKVLIQTFITAFIYSQLLAKNQTSIFFIDDITSLVKFKSLTNLIKDLVKKGKKCRVILMVIGGSVKDLVQNIYGKTLLKQASTVLVFRHESEAKNELKEVLGLTDTEIEYLTQAPVGSGILKVDNKRVLVKVILTEEELQLVNVATGQGL